MEEPEGQKISQISENSKKFEFFTLMIFLAAFSGQGGRNSINFGYIRRFPRGGGVVLDLPTPKYDPTPCPFTVVDV